MHLVFNPIFHVHFNITLNLLQRQLVSKLVLALAVNTTPLSSRPNMVMFLQKMNK